MEPLLTKIQSFAAEHVWNWLEELWENEQLDSERLDDLRAEVLPLFEQLENSSEADREGVIVQLIESLRAIPMRVFDPS